MSGQVEQFAQKLWENRSYAFIDKVEQACGYTKGELYGESIGPWGLKWEQIPEKAKDYLREIATQEVAIRQKPPTEIEQYLTTLFRELERLRPTNFGVTSHGVLWDEDWERLILSVNVGDAVYLHPLVPGDLTDDPLDTAASLVDKVKAEIDHPDADIVGFKR